MQSLKNKNISSMRIFFEKTRKGDDIYLKKAKHWKSRKLDERTSGLYRVVETHVNGTVTKELRPEFQRDLIYEGIYRKNNEC